MALPIVLLIVILVLLGYIIFLHLQLSTETLPSRNDNSDLIYQLAAQFIKGYVNHRTGIIVKNPGFDPLYDSPNFLKNIDLLKS